MYALIKRQEARAADDDSRALQKDASAQLVRLIDFLFALVLVQGAVNYRELFVSTDHWSAAAWLAVGAIYYTVIRSFIDWHIAMEDAHYKILAAEARGWELRRVYVDLGIVVAYAFLVLHGHRLISDPAADLSAFLATFPLIVVLYLAWGWLRYKAYGEQQFSERLLVATLVVYVALLVGYSASAPSATWNAVALALAWLTMAAFRHLNWRQQRIFSSPDTGAGG